MRLKSLEINGFKSFAKKGNLEFGSAITAIVGPNGSGKSNVAEAFRFVLGEQSIKSMRGKRGEDLIFNGGKSLARQNRASVKVVFDNTERKLNIDFDEVSLERVVHRDSANEYFINGSPARLKDIIELLSGAHIGASGHHIISQGEADRILNANLHERREMIEDALGLKIYHYKREESERKLEKTEENLKQVGLLRKEIAPHIKFLETQVKKVEKAREMRVEIEKLYLEYFKRESNFIKSEKEKIESEKKEPERRKKDLEKELFDAREILEKSQGKDAKSDDLLALDSKLHAVRVEKDSLMREAGRIDGQIASEERIIRKQMELAESENSKLIELREVEKLSSSLDIKIAEAEISQDLSIVKKILGNVREMFRDFIAKNKSNTNNALVQEGEIEILKLKKEKENIAEKIRETGEKEEVLTQEYSLLRKGIEEEKDKNRDAEKAVFRIMAEQNEVLSFLNAIKNNEEKINNIEIELKRELGEAGVLIGRAVLDYENSVIENEDADRSAQEARRKTIEKLKLRLEDSGGGLGEEVMKEYKEATERDGFLMREIEDLEKSAETLRVLIKDLEERLTVEFKNGVEKINKQFQEFFALMFGGGQASLQVVAQEKKKKRKNEMEDLMDENVSMEEMQEDLESEEGIDINVNLPQKKIKGLMMLSGGERALTSIALLFAVSQVNPPPFIILDETDAALDEANSRKYGDMIENLSKLSQLILITHNRETMSRAGILYGVTMGAEGFSKLLSIKFDEAIAVAK